MVNYVVNVFDGFKNSFWKSVNSTDEKVQRVKELCYNELKVTSAPPLGKQAERISDALNSSDQKEVYLAVKTLMRASQADPALASTVRKLHNQWGNREGAEFVQSLLVALHNKITLPETIKNNGLWHGRAMLGLYFSSSNESGAINEAIKNYAYKMIVKQPDNGWNYFLLRPCTSQLAPEGEGVFTITIGNPNEVFNYRVTCKQKNGRDYFSITGPKNCLVESPNIKDILAVWNDGKPMMRVPVPQGPQSLRKAYLQVARKPPPFLRGRRFFLVLKLESCWRLTPFAVRKSSCGELQI